MSQSGVVKAISNMPLSGLALIFSHLACASVRLLLTCGRQSTSSRVKEMNIEYKC